MIKSFFSNPLVGMIGTVASVVGLLLAVYFYYDSRRFPELAYYVNQDRVVLAKQGGISQLKYFYRDRELTSDVTAAQVGIYNRGKEAIRKSSILKPLIIEMDPSVPILEATLQRSSRDLLKFHLDKKNLSNGKLNVTWDILEQGDGGLIQLIYAGGSDVRISSNAVVEGQREIRKVEVATKSKLEGMRSGRITLYFLTTAFLIAGGINFWTCSRGKGSWREFYISIIFGGAFLCLLVYLAFFSAVEPPLPFR